ncbi:MAG: outer membrane protein [Candidatus Brocadiales bacterium]
MGETFSYITGVALLIMINPVFLALLLCISSLSFFFHFTSPVHAEDTHLMALYSGNTRLISPFQEEEEFRIIDGFEPGMRELSVSAGGSFSLEEPQIYTFTLLPKYGWILGTFNKPKGALEFELEPFFSVVKEPAQYSHEVGATIMIGYNFETGTKLVPFIHAGGGAIRSGMNTGGLSHVRDLEDAQGQGNLSDEDEAKKLLKSRLNAIAQLGLGVKYFFKDRTSFNVEYRWRHISDPSTHDDLGIDSQFFLFGLSYFY